MSPRLGGALKDLTSASSECIVRVRVKTDGDLACPRVDIYVQPVKIVSKGIGALIRVGDRRDASRQGDSVGRLGRAGRGVPNDMNPPTMDWLGREVLWVHQVIEEMILAEGTECHGVGGGRAEGHNGSQ